MRAAASVALAVLLCGGCSKEPSFDEAFNQQSANVQAKADLMQAELSNQLNAANAGHE